MYTAKIHINCLVFKKNVLNVLHFRSYHFIKHFQEITEYLIWTNNYFNDIITIFHTMKVKKKWPGHVMMAKWTITVSWKTFIFICTEESSVWGQERNLRGLWVEIILLCCFFVIFGDWQRQKYWAFTCFKQKLQQIFQEMSIKAYSVNIAVFWSLVYNYLNTVMSFISKWNLTSIDILLQRLFFFLKIIFY